jgi:hypothetical protein
MLESASHLHLSLVCARGSPIADMLAHSPLPLTINHFDKDQDISAEDEEGMILELQHRGRVRRIHLRKSVSISQRVVIALDGEFPILEYLLIEPPKFHWPYIQGTMYLPETFRAPRLRHLLLMSFDLGIESHYSLPWRAASSLCHSTQSHPPLTFTRKLCSNGFFFVPQLEMLEILFIRNLDFSRHDIERQLLRTPIMTRVTLPNLRCLGFRGSST